MDMIESMLTTKILGILNNIEGAERESNFFIKNVRITEALRRKILKKLSYYVKHVK